MGNSVVVGSHEDVRLLTGIVVRLNSHRTQQGGQLLIIGVPVETVIVGIDDCCRIAVGCLDPRRRGIVRGGTATRYIPVCDIPVCAGIEVGAKVIQRIHIVSPWGHVARQIVNAHGSSLSLVFQVVLDGCLPFYVHTGFLHASRQLTV